MWGWGWGWSSDRCLQCGCSCGVGCWVAEGWGLGGLLTIVWQRPAAVGATLVQRWAAAMRTEEWFAAGAMCCVLHCNRIMLRRMLRLT